MTDRRLILVAYRSVLRWARDNAAVPFQLRRGDVLLLAPGVVPSTLQDAAAVSQIARAAFHLNKDLKPEEAGEAVDRALDALRLLHDDYGGAIARMRALRGDRADRSGVAWPLGTVFAHAQHGYRGVVFGWDRECERDAEWAAAMGVRPRQPFYHVLPDEGDCVRLFGGVRVSKYVAQDNVVPLAGARVMHRALDNYFDGHDAGTGRYIPSRKLQFEYPDDYRALAPQPVGADSNLLAHEEWEVGPAGTQRTPGP
ncbi:hypothetical protein ACKKBG_A36535 [Auxenochlorella protothecoides x Auxenochlorella symbiontica]